jgi:transcriptional regulator with XRE-family HTH domain
MGESSKGSDPEEIPVRLCTVFGMFVRTLGLKPSRMSPKRSALHRDHAEFFAALGRRIKQLRKERGWSLHQMVSEHGYYQAQWQKYEKGGSLTIDSLLKIAEMFEISLGELIDSLGRFPHESVATVAEKPEQPSKPEPKKRSSGHKAAASKK